VGVPQYRYIPVVHTVFGIRYAFKSQEIIHGFHLPVNGLRYKKFDRSTPSMHICSTISALPIQTDSFQRLIAVNHGKQQNNIRTGYPAYNILTEKRWTQHDAVKDRCATSGKQCVKLDGQSISDEKLAVLCKSFCTSLWPCNRLLYRWTRINARPPCCSKQTSDYMPPGRPFKGMPEKTPRPGRNCRASLPRIGGLMADSATSRT
jgi:hypothetical protein